MTNTQGNTSTFRCSDRRRHRGRFLIALLLALAGFDANAAIVYCVNSMGGLRDALGDAENDLDHSEVRLVAGNYFINQGVDYLGFGTISFDLKLSGGWSTGCSSRDPDPATTTITGNGAASFFMRTDFHSIHVEGISLIDTRLEFSDWINGFSYECEPVGKSYLFNRMRFLRSALHGIADCHEVRVRSSLFVDAWRSDIGAASAITIAQEPGMTSLVANSTIVNGAVIATPSSMTIVDTLVSSSGSELVAEDGGVIAVLYSRYDSASGAVVDSGGNLSADPQLDANHRPLATSPLIHAGTADVPGGLPATDIDDNPRVVGPAVDIGAFEAPEEIAEPIDPLIVTHLAASGIGSLAGAVEAANADPGRNTIRFDIGGSCPKRIVLAAPLTVQDGLVIAGFTQPGAVRGNGAEGDFDSVPCVILDGSGAADIGIQTGASIGSESLFVSGLGFDGFATAIALTFGRHHSIAGNQFGGRVGNSSVVLGGNGHAVELGFAAERSVIGGAERAQANLIGASSDAGIELLLGPGRNIVANNLIGVDRDQRSPLANVDGIQIRSNDNEVFDNVISRNTRDGIALIGADSHANVIVDNRIGGTSTGFALHGNGRAGVLLMNDAHDNHVGPGNFIWENDDSGIRVLSSAGGHNRLIGNRLAYSGSPGIDLGNNGVNANDLDPLLCDLELGCAANRGQNYPVVQQVLLHPGVGGPRLQIRGALTSTVSARAYRLDVYRGLGCNASGHGEGDHWLGTQAVVVTSSGLCASGNCTASFDFTLPAQGSDLGDAISVTATSPDGDTSEFSACRDVSELAVLPLDAIFKHGFENFSIGD